ncbi:hypothetical protein [Treponema sp. Marseille-Q4130]|uniref:hypothetical protein n=1 Tax=Treponema sp. Marseille-Q4130 TaxID=2766702 RepID=UPI0016524382|nr:hypothetical protein [Treponema sp. Marseille-Q4130]MBC6720309.1 hypothetical protein [Treponema sp. Marseille-Q4130]DAU96564.1 MAG TPA: Protein of unknown function (DUF3277) [Caudoviricetes sp.]
MGKHTIIAAGQFTATITHPLINGGAPTTIDGFKLEGQMVQAQQAMDSSKVIALANGNTITITNNNGAGTLTFNVVKTSTDGDMVKIARSLQKAGDSVGGTIRITQDINGVTEGTTFYACTVKSCPPITVQGNDAPDYQVVWNYGETDDN